MYLDENLHQHFQSLPSLPFSKLLKSSAKSRNESRKALQRTGQLPVFEYPKVAHLNLEPFRSQARIVRRDIENETSSPILKNLYLDKLTELETRADLLEAVKQGNDQRVSQLSLKLFGNPTLNLGAYEQEFRERLERIKAGEVHYHTKTINAEQLHKMLEAALQHYGVTNWKIQISPRKRFQCSHNHKAAAIVFRIPKKLSISLKRASELIAHEIEVHTLRRLNGADSSLHLLKRGLAGYAKTEEGLALYHQHHHHLPRKHLPGFWDAWASALMHEVGFAATFDRLSQAQLELLEAKGDVKARLRAKSLAWNLCLRSSRGITKPGAPGIGYFRDHIYRQGYIEITDAVREHGDNLLPKLFVGKVGLTDLPALQQLNLKPGRLPDDIAKNIVAKTRRSASSNTKPS